MHAAILLFERFDALDAVTAHEALAGAGVTATFVGERIGPVRGDSRSIELTVDAVLDELPHPDIVVVPGGAGIHRHLVNGTVHRWLRAADTTSTWTIAIGGGSLIAATAGVLDGRAVAADDRTFAVLGRHRAEPVRQATVIDGRYGTTVSSHHAPDLIRDVLALTTHPQHLDAKGTRA
ncbi:DJ-1/PfpI family protein [Naasia sp. SYSU D00948]|uniref:DJ-1/PfpI family protein n=1 Tax=Naasia sp. SYSU D00948 TaxID=2817379 RepID=UPI001B313B30|nr:DJ-1/PfpI family protein [Naasia sp. SYSU D00948]